MSRHFIHATFSSSNNGIYIIFKNIFFKETWWFKKKTLKKMKTNLYISWNFNGYPSCSPNIRCKLRCVRSNAKIAQYFVNWSFKRNWVFATNSNFLIYISLQPNVVDFWYFKLWYLLVKIILVWNIKGLHHPVAEI